MTVEDINIADAVRRRAQQRELGRAGRNPPL